jgi:hypothetical protein
MKNGTLLAFAPYAANGDFKPLARIAAWLG